MALAPADWTMEALFMNQRRKTNALILRPSLGSFCQNSSPNQLGSFCQKVCGSTTEPAHVVIQLEVADQSQGSPMRGGMAAVHALR
jgi:hypothetical protein